MMEGKIEGKVLRGIPRDKYMGQIKKKYFARNTRK
jgi:hypothetical protein